MRETEVKIVPKGTAISNLAQIWDNRELLYFFAWRDIKVKYKQTYLGILWVILQPTLLTILFYFVFARALKISEGTVAYPVYIFAGLTLWGLFSSAITHSSESLLSSSQIIRKIYFPRILIPLASLLTSLIDYLVTFVLLILLLLFFRPQVSWTIVYCYPLAIAFTLTSAFGIGTLLAALNVKYRDFRYLLPFVMQLLFFASQIVYSIHSLSKSWLKQLLYVNPLNGALELFYHPFQTNLLDSSGLLISMGSSFFFLAAGLYYFKKTEVFFADII